ncbi:MAG: ferredoxin reductase [Gammaproteobacteria bacterium]|nr:ferredoxin reductase [Gammaproteobacteria bacterium]
MASTLSQAGKAWSWFIGSLTNHKSMAAYFEPIIQGVLPAWRSDKIRTQVREIRYENADMFTLVLKPSKQWQGFSAGQYIELTVQKDGAWISRFFSISSSPTYFQRTGLIELSIRIQEKGRITPWLPQALHKGEFVNISPALGDFTLDSKPASVCFIAGGSGITPFRSMLQNIQLEQTQSKQAITLMYYARSAQHFAFADDFEQLAAQHSNITLKLINSEIDGNISSNHLEYFSQANKDTHFYVCGPSPMIQSARQLLKERNYPDDQVHYEFFGPEPIHTDIQTDATQVLFARSHKQVSSTQNSQQTLLELAESHDLKPVSGCRMGVCHQCICQKQSGVVYNTKTKTYSDTGAQEIQLCVSLPINDVVLDL